MTIIPHHYYIYQYDSSIVLTYCNKVTDTYYEFVDIEAINDDLDTWRVNDLYMNELVVDLGTTRPSLPLTTLVETNYPELLI